MIAVLFVWTQLMIAPVPTSASPSRSSFLNESFSDHARMHSARFYTHRKYFCGAYVQYDVLLEEALLQLHAKEKISNEVKKIVKNLFNVANAVFSATKSKYLKNIVFYVRRLQQRAVREIGVDEFVRKNHVKNSDPYCFLVHITATHPNRQRDYLGFGNVGSLCNTHRIGPTSRALHGMAMAVNVPKLKSAKYVHELTFIHELGHVLGAEHDGMAELIVDGTMCPVWDVDPENNIMFYKSRDQFHVRQRSFSECSIRQIDHTLESVFESGAQKTCFDSFGELVCGNGIVEEDEECDCGFSEELCSEDQKCCNPANSSDPLKEGKPCELRKDESTGQKVQCSVSNGPCCNGTSCQFLGEETICEAASLCRNASHCSGSSAQCPQQALITGNIRCPNNSTCLDGDCKGSLCTLYNLTRCKPPSPRPEELCKVFCQSPETNKCTMLCDLQDESCDLKVSAGSKCADDEGTCNSGGRCFRTQRSNLRRNVITIAGIFSSMILYFYVIVILLPKVPHGNFARSRAARKLEKKVLNYVKRLQNLNERERT